MYPNRDLVLQGHIHDLAKLIHPLCLADGLGSPLSARVRSHALTGPDKLSRGQKPVQFFNSGLDGPLNLTCQGLVSRLFRPGKGP